MPASQATFRTAAAETDSPASIRPPVAPNIRCRPVAPAVPDPACRGRSRRRPGIGIVLAEGASAGDVRPAASGRRIRRRSTVLGDLSPPPRAPSRSSSSIGSPRVWFGFNPSGCPVDDNLVETAHGHLRRRHRLGVRPKCSRAPRISSCGSKARRALIGADGLDGARKKASADSGAGHTNAAAFVAGPAGAGVAGWATALGCIRAGEQL